MPLSVCRTVPVLLALAALPGCFDSHGLGHSLDAAVGPVDAAPHDAGIDGPWHTPADVGPEPRDASPTTCTERPLDFACTNRGNGAVPAGEAFDLPVSLGDGHDCFCGETVDCSVVVHDRMIEITSYECVGPLLCDGCFPFIHGSCAIPALDEGSYRVRVNGAESFDLMATNATPAVGPVDVCETVPDDHGCGTIFTPSTLMVGRYCHLPEVASAEPSTITATVTVGCGDLPICEVRRTASFLEVVVRTIQTACDVDCGPGEITLDVACAVPALEAGTYTVSTSSLSVGTTLVVSDSPSAAPEICTAP